MSATRTGRRDAAPLRGTRSAQRAPGARGARGAALVAATVLLAVAAELPMIRVFGSPGLRLVLLAALPACLVTAGALALAHRGRAGAAGQPGGEAKTTGTGTTGATAGPATAVAAAAGLAAGALPGLMAAAPDPFGPASLAQRLPEALTDGWYRLLSVPVPVPFSRTFTDLPVLLAAALATIITLCALSRRPAVAAAPAVAGFGGLLVLGADGPVTGTALTGGFALAVVIFLVAAAPPAQGAVRSHGATAGVAGGALIAVAVLIVGALHPAAPYNPRAKVRLPVDIHVAQDPLHLLPALLQTPSVPVLTARLTGALLADPRNWLLLTYDTDNGAGWTAPGDARPTVTAGAVPAATGTGTASVVAASPLTLLPHPAAVLGSSPASLDYAPRQEMLAAPSPVRQYTVRVSVGLPSEAALAAAALPSGTSPALTSVPSCVPAALHTLASDVSAAASLPGEQVEQLEAYFTAAPFRYDHAAAPGEGCASISRMLSARKGTSAQFATAFVLTARLLAIPARVAVGYSPGTLSGNVATVTDGDAHAWAQVELTGIGWMDVDPTPKAAAKGQTPAREKQPAISKLRSAPPKSTHPGKPVITAPAPPPGGPGTAGTVLLGLAGFLAILLTWMLAVWSYGASRRSRRRRAAEPAARVLGAWDEALAVLALSGVRIAGHSAPSVAEQAARDIPRAARPVRELAALAERALYGHVGNADADAAWGLSDRARPAVLAATGRGKRLRRLFVPARSGTGLSGHGRNG